MVLEDEGIPFVFHQWGWQCQLVAIGSLLNRNEEADKELAEEIKRIDEAARRAQGRANEYAVEHYVELVEGSFYQDAAHSMAAVGMLAPFLESIFRSTFVSIDAPFSVKGGTVSGIVRGVKAAGMGEYMPADLEPTLVALFEYRNKMFHGGFEWSPKELGKFQSRLDENVWPSEWFAVARFGDDPWMFYMAPDFIDHCFALAAKVVEGLDQYCWDKLGCSSL